MNANRSTSLYSSIYAYNGYKRYQWVANQARKLPENTRILDVGAGRGRYRELFTHCAYRAHDFGQEPGTIGSYTQLDYESDIISIPVPDESFDAILCTEVLEHVPEPIKAVHELARILRPNGTLLLSAPLGSFLHQEPYHFYGGYTPYWYEKFLPEAGFTIQSIDANGGFFRLFGQESMRFSALIDPRRTSRSGLLWVGLTLLWIVTLPWMRVLLPLLGVFLDRLRLEHAATAGYHVVAVKK
ncbi:MAG: class I SAM-dependent methyltransferase [Chloroflexaceae bacterium]|nr:class I SAM-dependent methyltransferase [Chloroflexaceae bacterium]